MHGKGIIFCAIALYSCGEFFVLKNNYKKLKNWRRFYVGMQNINKFLKVIVNDCSLYLYQIMNLHLINISLPALQKCLSEL